MGLNSKSMPGLSIRPDESSLDCKKLPENLEPAGSSIDLDPFSEGSFLKSEPDKLRFGFNKFLGLFLKEICAQGCVCSLPPMAEGGQPVDWLKLFLVVREKGGYNAVSESGLWDSVASESGLGLNVASLVKLVYLKYLVSLERWLERIVQSEDLKSESHYTGNLVEMGIELKRFLLESKKIAEFSQVEESVVAGSGGGGKFVNGEQSMDIDITKDFLDYNEVEKLRNDDDLKSVVVDSDGEKKFINVDEYVHTPSGLVKSAGNSTDVEKFCNEDEVKSAIMEDSVECKKCTHSDDDVVKLDSSDIKEKLSSNKRKRDSSAIMEDSFESKKCTHSDDDVVKLDSSDIKEKLSSNKRKRDSSAIMEDSAECKKYTQSDDDVVKLDSSDIKEKFSSNKRKRDSMWGMLNWVKEVAMDPCDLVVGSLPESSKWKSYGSGELWKQILLFRVAAFHRKDDHSSSDQSKRQKTQKIHPCMYDDNTKIGYNLRERLSCTKKLLFGKTIAKGQNWSQSSGNHSDFNGTCDSVTPGSVFDYEADIQVPIGPQFQFEVPVWTGVASGSDAKWLGTRFWPLEKKENKFLIERDRIGKGRQDSCGCQVQGSLQCVKFHVAEKRSKLKLELGPAFKKLKFDKMGEDVASAWKEGEQKMFSNIVKSNPSSQQKCFWDEICKHFRNKSREELVCYYYNVFLLQRRAYQNRVTPSNIDSDDEPESELVAKGIGQEAIKPYTSILISPKKSQKKPRYSSK
ncbi:AT-rich interactive domain-containing protein 1-like [Gossypium australe]|uniref:AT-rich interactive domain-containing protein 1-like n=1 Tax=Gossypium australe TaxID=47621 RepID=A0A5B6UQR8_9ROSI|nr:AT-rich interactive domain-containing protein 1-like [Gossypium australe]